MCINLIGVEILFAPFWAKRLARKAGLTLPRAVQQNFKKHNSTTYNYLTELITYAQFSKV